ncbi:MAG: hypothetical protein K6F04_03955 [bacterium]|nr:hypothetical protein [bacterium]
MKKLLPILCVLTACSSTETTNNYNMNQTPKHSDKKETSRTYKVYENEVDAFVCDKSKKGNFTYCDVNGEKITGYIKSSGSYISYYENGEQLNGIIFYPSSNQVRNYFKKSADGNKFTLITYYKDGSILSKETDDKIKGRTSTTYKQGEEKKPYYDESQINILVEAFNS